MIGNQDKPMPDCEVLLYDLKNVEDPVELLPLLSQVHRMTIPKCHQELMDAIGNATERVVAKIEQKSLLATNRLKLVQEDVEAGEKAKAMENADDDI